MTAKIRKLSIFIFLLLFAIMTWFGVLCYRAWVTPLTMVNTASVKVYPGSGIEDLAHRLYQQRLIKYPHIVVALARIKGYSHQLRYGEYEINPGMTVMDLLHNISHARGMVKHRITFIEGWTFEQMLNALAEDTVIKHTLHGKTDAEIMAVLGYPNQKPEGLFFPSTYVFLWGNSDVDVLRHAYKKMQSIMEQLWPQRSQNLPYSSPYQALIVASLIEKETAINDESAKIAGVIVQRLRKRMRLQIDPTVLYGVNKPYGTPIMKKDLVDSNPYNTYRNYGLPPTPIDMPGLASIQAALRPEEASYLFYVARGDGSHIFSETYQQHKEAVKRYRHLELDKVDGVSKSPSVEKHWESKLLWHSPLGEFAAFLLRFKCI